jgi:hypothetical protein
VQDLIGTLERSISIENRKQQGREVRGLSLEATTLRGSADQGRPTRKQDLKKGSKRSFLKSTYWRGYSDC